MCRLFNKTIGEGSFSAQQKQSMPLAKNKALFLSAAPLVKEQSVYQCVTLGRGSHIPLQS